jgi:hypothetical protein
MVLYSSYRSLSGVSVERFILESFIVKITDDKF